MEPQPAGLLGFAQRAAAQRVSRLMNGSSFRQMTIPSSFLTVIQRALSWRSIRACSEPPSQNREVGFLAAANGGRRDGCSSRNDWVPATQFACGNRNCGIGCELCGTCSHTGEEKPRAPSSPPDRRRSDGNRLSEAVAPGTALVRHQ